MNRRDSQFARELVWFTVSFLGTFSLGNRALLGMYPNIVIGEDRMWDSSLDRGHVTGNATAARTHFTYEPRLTLGRRRMLGSYTGRSARVARQAFGFVIGGSLLGIAVRTVARQAIERPSTLQIAATPREIRGGKTYREGIIASNVLPERTVALTAQGNDLVPCAITAVWPRDCHVAELERDRLQVVCSRPMTTFAANPTIGRLGTRLIAC